MPHDERQGLPSASETERLALCKAAFVRSKNQPDKTSKDAQTGNNVHESLETGDKSGLTRAEEQMVDEANQLALEVFDETGFDRDKCKLLIEQRFWFERNGSVMFSGKPDLVAINGKRALIIDYKTGYLETLEAAQNLQLRALAVLVEKNIPEVEEISVAIVQPNLIPGYTVARYAPGDLTLARAQVVNIFDEAIRGEGDATPGEKQCRYCKAKPVCDEAQAESFEVIKADPKNLDVARLPELLEKCDLADRVIKAIRDAALDVVKDGGTVPGWELPKAGKSRSFVSTAAVFHAVGDVIERDAFANACNISITALESAWLDATDDEETKTSRLGSLKARLEPITVYKDKSVRKLRKSK